MIKRYNSNKRVVQYILELPKKGSCNFKSPFGFKYSTFLKVAYFYGPLCQVRPVSFDHGSKWEI